MRNIYMEQLITTPDIQGTRGKITALDDVVATIDNLVNEAKAIRAQQDFDEND